MYIENSQCWQHEVYVTSHRRWLCSKGNTDYRTNTNEKHDSLTFHCRFNVISHTMKQCLAVETTDHTRASKNTSTC